MDRHGARGAIIAAQVCPPVSDLIARRRRGHAQVQEDGKNPPIGVPNVDDVDARVSRLLTYARHPASSVPI
jgi:hypothetical protein